MVKKWFTFEQRLKPQTQLSFTLRRPLDNAVCIIETSQSGVMYKLYLILLCAYTKTIYGYQYLMNTLLHSWPCPSRRQARFDSSYLARRLLLKFVENYKQGKNINQLQLHSLVQQPSLNLRPHQPQLELSNRHFGLSIDFV